MILEIQYTNEIVKSSVGILVPVDNYYRTFGARNNHEVLFRKIAGTLIKGEYIPATSSIIDSGAWIGDNSIPWGSVFSGDVIAIDPSPGNCNYIRELAILNSLDNVKVAESALSDRKGIISTEHDLYHATFSTDQGGRNKVACDSLDNFWTDGLFEDVGFIHLDVEGMEWHAIQGSVDLIETYRPIIAFEQHLLSDNYTELSMFLEGMGYEVFMINETLPGNNPDCRNFLAVFADSSEEIVNYVAVELKVKKPLINWKKIGKNGFLS